MKQKLCVGERYALTKQKPKYHKIKYISLLAVLTSMCLYAAKQVSAQQAEPAETAVADTTIAVRDTLAIDEVEIINTGYQRIPKERATGSFVQIDNELLNRGVSANILDRLDGVSNGLLFHRGTSDVGFSVRGRSTIFANTSPAIVVDNFLYDGDISSINPNDVASVTVLKDAAAASIWGVRAGNGVVVITTKRGSGNQIPKVSANLNVSIREKPNLLGKPEMSTAQMIEVERFLFDNGVYNSALESPYQGVSPLVEALAAHREGLMPESALDAEIARLSNIDARSDYLAQYYRPATQQQYAVNVSGGSNSNTYYISAGYDKSLESFRSDGSSRLTLNAANTYQLLAGRLELSSNIVFTTFNDRYPPKENTLLSRQYMPLLDDEGNPFTSYPYRRDWAASAADGRLLDWGLRPWEEFWNNEHRQTRTTYLLNTGLKFGIVPGLNIQVRYQYQKGSAANDTDYDDGSFYVRDLVNLYTQVNQSTGSIIRPVAEGHILNSRRSEYVSHNARAQLDFTRSFGAGNEVSIIAGGEVKDYRTGHQNQRLYGYTEELGSFVGVDHTQPQPIITTGSMRMIPSGRSIGHQVDRFVSYYANGAYTLKDRYTVSGSARWDASNLFGVKANQRGTPLWSGGLGWTLSKEPFFRLPWIDHLRLRGTLGYSGNVDKSVSAYTTAINYGLPNAYGVPYNAIMNPPNPSLRWEKVGMLNLGMNFVVLGNRLSGSIEYYAKHSKDLIGNSPLPPSAGITEFRGNSANIKGHGIDVEVTSHNIVGSDFNWQTTLLVNFNRDRVTRYLVASEPLGIREGRPINSITSYRWAGLDAETGNPMGYLDGSASPAWGTIINLADTDGHLRYHGSAVPTAFGSMRQTFDYRNFQLSFLITYRAGYFFRAPSINYSLLFGSLDRAGHIDFAKRWKRPGDESRTHVPAMVYPTTPSRDQFYANSEVLVHRGDQVRLRDVRLSYDIAKGKFGWMPTGIRLFAYASDLLLIWKANQAGLDPDFLGLPMQKRFAVGLQISY